MTTIDVMRLELRGITKRFGSLTANDQISITVEPGQIHSLLGENGAGKSTLMNVLFGLLTPDEGEILINGEPVQITNSGDAVRRGLGMVHQHFMLVPVFTVTENVVLGFEPTKSLNRVDYRKATEDILRLSRQFNLDVDPDAVVERLPIGLQQRVEILKALSHDAELLILDEPTAVLTPQEIDALMEIMRSLAAAGKSILFITHKLKEVKAVADVITIIRQGRVVGTAEPTASESELASMMVGRDVELTVHKEPFSPGGDVFEIRDLVVRDERGLAAVNGVSLSVRAGEILALAGVQGNGQTELVEAIAGMRTVESGSITLNGRDITNHSPREVLDAGLGHIPEDRQRDGLVMSMSVADNLVLNTPRRVPFARRGTRDLAAVQAHAVQLIKDFDIRTESPQELVSSLSGGNQQKVIVARELSRALEFLVASQPTRGLDVGSIEYVHRQMVEHRNHGNAALVVSSELDEVLALGDRIAVMYAGKISGVVDPSTSRETIGLLMTGTKVEQPHD
jgi:simple sugar transport system ATP-binding protein